MDTHGIDCPLAYCTHGIDGSPEGLLGLPEVCRSRTCGLCSCWVVDCDGQCEACFDDNAVVTGARAE